MCDESSPGEGSPGIAVRERRGAHRGTVRVLSAAWPRGDTATGEDRMAANVTDETSGLVSIGQLAKAAGVSSRTIRYYEELGILPEPDRSSGGTRRYPREYRGYIDTALTLKNLGFRLEEIGPLARLAIGRPVSPAQRETAARLVEERIAALGRQVSALRRLRDSVRGPD
jgi:DNA-binding transcriptional MerR regulator